MVCSECGKAASGNFCSHCGMPLVEVVNADHEAHYETLIRQPEVREKIAACAARAGKSTDPTKYLQICDKVLELMGSAPVCSVAALMVPVASRLGLSTGKSEKRIITAPVGRVIVAVLCAMAQQGRAIRAVHQGENGLVIEAEIAADLWTWQGEMAIGITRLAQGTEVEASVKIHGQWIDWGKSSRCLRQLFEDLNQLLR